MNAKTVSYIVLRKWPLALFTRITRLIFEECPQLFQPWDIRGIKYSFHIVLCRGQNFIRQTLESNHD